MKDEKSAAAELLKLSADPSINRLLNSIVHPLKEYTETQTKRMNELILIGVALSSTRNLDMLLELIVDKSREFTNADGGTLYLVNDAETHLNFSIVQTESLGFRMGGASGSAITLPPVPLKKDGEPNNANVCASVANSGRLVNIPDVYEVEGYDFQGTRGFDAGNNYRSKSMLVVPLLDHEFEIIGVLQLINARDPQTNETIEFDPEYLVLTEALASQAAVALTNARLIHDMEELFESFIRTIAAAIDEKSPYTGGHITRVANLTVKIAKRINSVDSGFYADVHFSDDIMNELRIAAWLHDTGKITTPEYVIDKRTKLETIFDRKEMVRYRFELAMANARLEDNAEEKINRLKDDLEFVLGSNATSEFVSDEKLNRLKSIGEGVVMTSQGEELLLTENELYNLCIRKGNLTAEERKTIENHALMTIKLLEQLPFPKKMRDVPAIAGAHHEKLNGKGYPLGLKADEINLQARIMALADIFEALTAKDRPYKEPKKLSECMRILGFMVKDSELDSDLIDFFIEQKMHLEYAREHLNPVQNDLE